MPDEAPYRNFNFRVEVDGLPELGFQEVVIPWTRIEFVEYREGGDNVSGTRKLPARAVTGNVVLRRGIDQDLALWNWFKSVRDGTLDRRNVVDRPAGYRAHRGPALEGLPCVADGVRVQPAPRVEERDRDRDDRARVRTRGRRGLSRSPSPVRGPRSRSRLAGRRRPSARRRPGALPRRSVRSPRRGCERCSSR